MLDGLTGLVLKFTVLIYSLAIVFGIYLVVSSFINLNKLADTQSQMSQQEVTGPSLITKVLFGTLLVVSNIVAVATAISLGASESTVVDPVNYLNYSTVTDGVDTNKQLIVFIKAVSRFIGAVAITSGLKYGADMMHPIENIRKTARYRLVWGVFASVFFLFPELLPAGLQHIFPQLEDIVELLRSVP